MILKNPTPMLLTWDIPVTIEFYERRLGFTCHAYNEEWGWTSLRCGTVALMLSAPNSHEGDAAPAFTGSLSFRVEDLKDLWAGVKDEMRVCYPPEDFEDDMREFAIHDNNGYLLQFGQELRER